MKKPQQQTLWSYCPYFEEMIWCNFQTASQDSCYGCPLIVNMGHEQKTLKRWNKPALNQFAFKENKTK